MRPRIIQDEDLIKSLMRILRAKGYDGASLSLLAQATGLKKASLYHRFPGGKKEMTEAVLTYIESWIDQAISSVISKEDLSPKAALKQVNANIYELYEGGKELCALRSLSMDTGLQLFGPQIRQCLEKWINAYYKLGKRLDLNEELAKTYAQQSLIEIQGSLLLASTLKDTKVFKRTLAQIYDRYFQP